MRNKQPSASEVPKRVLIVYHYIAHYREALFRTLSASQDPEYTIAAGIRTEIPIRTADPSLASRPLSEGGIRWRFLRNLWLKPFLWQVGLLRCALGSRYDVLVFLGCPYYLSTWVACLLARCRGKRTLIWGHGCYSEERGIKKILRKLFHRLPHGVLTYGEHARDLLLRMGLSPDCLYVVYNSLDYGEHLRLRQGLNAEIRLRTRRELMADADDPLIIFVGRLTAQKQLDLLIRVLAGLQDRDVKAQLLIVGDGEERAKLEQCSQDWGLQGVVRFFGACYDQEKLAQMLHAADVCVSPGDVGLTAIHSLSFGTPVVTHGDYRYQMPEAEAVVPGQTGAFFERGSVASLVQTLEDNLPAWRSERQRFEAMCYRTIDGCWNPRYQAQVFRAAVCAEPQPPREAAPASGGHRPD